MAEPRQNRDAFQIQVSYSFDRLLEPKLARAYEILVPCREHPVGVRMKECSLFPLAEDLPFLGRGGT
jgi:hypothetical protein